VALPTDVRVEPVTVVRAAEGHWLPIVCDSPHSGTVYPGDFGAIAPMNRLRQGEDTHVDTLFADAPAHGATLLHANFPRAYIDPNRSVQDLDPRMLGERWHEPLQPGPKSLLGYGLIWRQIDAATPIYDRLLSASEVRARIEHYWQPYQRALHQAIDDSVRTFGKVWHLNLHSMPNNAYERLGFPSPPPLADFVLGDRDGTTCEPQFVNLIAEELRRMGYTVALNDPYKGAALIAQIGRPGQHRHSLQLEIRRPLYMDEATRQPNHGFMPLRANLSKLMASVADYVKQHQSACLGA
jgi:N-formylglutamate deformylase